MGRETEVSNHRESKDTMNSDEVEMEQEIREMCYLHLLGSVLGEAQFNV